MKFNNIKELQEFIIWCKQNNVLRFKLDMLEFDILSTTFQETDNLLKEIELDSKKTWTEDEQPSTKETEDPDLFWSTNG